MFLLVPPLANGRTPETSPVNETAPKEGAAVPLPCSTVPTAPCPVCATTPEPSVKRTPLSVVKLLKVTVLEAVKLVVVMPVAPVIAPAEVILRDGVERKLVKPVAEAKEIPLTILELLLAAAGKEIPFKVLELLVLVALVRERLRPLMEVAVAVVLPLVKEKEDRESLFV